MVGGGAVQRKQTFVSQISSLFNRRGCIQESPAAPQKGFVAVLDVLSTDQVRLFVNHAAASACRLQPNCSALSTWHFEVQTPSQADLDLFLSFFCVDQDLFQIWVYLLIWNANNGKLKLTCRTSCSQSPSPLFEKQKLDVTRVSDLQLYFPVGTCGSTLACGSFSEFMC